MWSRNLRVLVVSVCLALLVFVPIGYWSIVENQKTAKSEPYKLYFSSDTLTSYDNETFINVWNKTKSLNELSEFLRLGNYSVLIYRHGYATLDSEYDEWFVIASTLQPNSEGLIHQATLRLDRNCNLIASYEQTVKFNLSSVEDGNKTLNDFTINAGYNPYSAHFYYNFYPFLGTFVNAGDFGIVVILNLETGKIMVAATSVWMGIGGLLYPENIPKLGD